MYGSRQGTRKLTGPGGDILENIGRELFSFSIYHTTSETTSWNLGFGRNMMLNIKNKID